MKTLHLLLFLLLFPIAASAAVDFHCYSAPGTPVQGFEYNSSHCEAEPRVETVGKDGEKDILCLYQAICKPVTKDEAKSAPPEKSMGELMNAIQSQELKTSVLVCKGRGTVSNGILATGQCPTPTECQRDVFYNMSLVSMSPNIPTGVSAPVKPKEVSR